MKLQALTTLLLFTTAFSGTETRAQPQHQHHAHREVASAAVARAAAENSIANAARRDNVGGGGLEFRAVKRQVGPVNAAAGNGNNGTPPTTPSTPPSPAPTSSAPLTTTNTAVPNPSAGNPSQTSSPSTMPAGSGTSMTTTLPTPVVPVPAGTNGVPPLSLISYGMTPGTPSPVVSTYAPGATPPIRGAPPLPSQFTFNAASWPAQDKVPDTTTPEVKQWMQELNGFDIPSWSPTADGTCAGDPTAASEASERGWWTCGRTTRNTDITACPKKLDWGVSFDDGPSPWSEKLLNYLDTQSIKATFFVVGSRVVERPQVLIEEFMAGHEISVHTWSHRHLTTLTNEQIVAELGWTRKAIEAVLGVTPTTMRPPYGDIDDRVRAIALAMGMVPIIWTGTAASGPFDTNDWRVAGGLVDSTTSFNTFEAILGNATSLDTGFIVLQHDLYEITVDLAVGYTLNAALTHTPPFSLKPIGTCLNIPEANMYAESNTNATFPYRNHTVVTSSNSDTNSSDPTSTTQKLSNSAAGGGTYVSWIVAGLIGGGCGIVHSLVY